MLRKFRADSVANKLPTPSGRIEITSPTIASFNYEDCAGHPAWFEPAEWLGSPLATEFPLHLMSHQPATRLHSQYDHGSVSLAAKIQGREAITLNPDAAVRGIKAGDVVRVYNNRGACLAGAKIDDGVRPAWWCCRPARGLTRLIRHKMIRSKSTATQTHHAGQRHLETDAGLQHTPRW